MVFCFHFGGPNEIRTRHLSRARGTLCQMSYWPILISTSRYYFYVFLLFLEGLRYVLVRVYLYRHFCSTGTSTGIVAVLDHWYHCHSDFGGGTSTTTCRCIAVSLFLERGAYYSVSVYYDETRLILAVFYRFLHLFWLFWGFLWPFLPYLSAFW